MTLKTKRRRDPDSDSEEDSPPSPTLPTPLARPSSHSTKRTRSGTITTPTSSSSTSTAMDLDFAPTLKRTFFLVVKRKYKGRTNVKKGLPTSFKSYYFYTLKAANEFVRREAGVRRSELSGLLDDRGCAEWDDTNWEWTYRKEVRVSEEVVEIVPAGEKGAKVVKVHRGGQIRPRDWRVEEGRRDREEMRKLKKLGLLSEEAEKLLMRVFEREEDVEFSETEAEEDESSGDEVASERTAGAETSDVEHEEGNGDGFPERSDALDGSSEFGARFMKNGIRGDGD